LIASPPRAGYIELRKWQLLFVIVVISCVAYWQLTNPLPVDLQNILGAYRYSPLNNEFTFQLLKRDFFSFGVLAVMSRVFPNTPELYYLLNIFLQFFSIYFIFRQLQIKNAFMSWTILILLNLCCLNFYENHHYMRQTTAYLLFMMSLFLENIKRYLTWLLACGWHGSIILFLPVFLLNRASRSFKILVSLLVLTFVISEINIYQYMTIDNFKVSNWESFRIVDRFLSYFIENRSSQYFDQYKEIGNPYIYFYVSCLFLAFGLETYKKTEDRKVFSLLALITIWALLFKYHYLIYPRMIYFLEISWIFYLIYQLKDLTLPVRWQRLAPVCALAIAGFKIYYF